MKGYHKIKFIASQALSGVSCGLLVLSCRLLVVG